MAALQHLATNTEQALPARVLVGRAAACFLRVKQPLASSEHAVVQWSEDGWTVRDLGSRNGTYVDGHALQSGAVTSLSQGSRIAFGDPNDAWLMTSDVRPEPIAVELSTRETCVGSGGLLCIPNDDDPTCSVFPNHEGEWVLDRGGEMEKVTDQIVVREGGRSWCLLLPGLLDQTPFIESPISIETVKFRFVVSRNEEHVTMELIGAERSLALEPREHHYVLLTLARLRLEESALAPTERGWIDRAGALKLLAMSANTFNVAIHRARRQLIGAGVVGASDIVEVRRGERRFGSDKIEIVTE